MSEDRLRILHLIGYLAVTNAQYHEHCLPVADERTLSICCYYPPVIEADPRIAVFPGDGTIAGFRRALRAAVRARSFDVIHVHAPQLATILAVTRLASHRHTPRIYTLHNSVSNYSIRDRALLLISFATADRVVCCSHAVERSLTRGLRWLSRHKRDTVDNGADTERIDAIVAATTRREDDTFRVAAVGRLIPRKNVETLLAAFARMERRDASLTIIGDGESRRDLERRAAELDIADRVEFTGLLDRDAMYRRLVDADLGVSMSFGEGLPVATLEVMAAGCPVVLSDIEPHQQIAAGTSTLPLIGTTDIAALTSELDRFASMAAHDRRELGRRCREIVLSRFSVTAMHRGYERVYRRMVGNALRETGGVPAREGRTHG